LEAACNLLCGAPEDVISAVRVTLPLRQPSREALPAAVLGQRLAIEHGLDAVASLDGFSMTIRLSRQDHAGGVLETANGGRGRAAHNE